MSEQEIDSPGELIDNRYEILNVLGSGGTTRVYRVVDRETGEELALKILDPRIEVAYYRSLFQHEFLVLSRLRHPNIVAVYDFGSYQDRQYFTMEYLAGQHIGHLSGTRDFDRLTLLLVKILQTLQFVHAKGLLHGDIKPQNILVLPGNDIKLTDFGMTGEIVLNKSAPGHPVLGTLPYMAPEVIRSFGSDQRADLYSLGIMIYEILSGQLPFQSAEPFGVLRQHLTKTPQPLRLLCPDCPEYLATIVSKCLEKRPLDRYQSADEVLREIARYRPDLAGDETVPMRESYILTSEFVGRRKELDYLVRNFELALGGNGQTVMIGGDTGVGKSRLLNEFKIHCQLEGATVLQAHCQEYESRPHQTMVTLCRQLLLSSGAIHEIILSRYGSELQKLAPDFDLEELIPTTEASDPNFDPTVERTRFYDGLTQLFIDVSRTTPLVLLIENLQWIDQVTLGILQYLIRNLGKAYIVICGTFLDEVLHSTALLGRKNPLETMIVENRHNPNFHEVILESLKAGDVASMVGSMLGMAFKPEEFGRALHEETGGNPFIITEIMKQLVRDRMIFREKGEWIIDVDDLSMLTVPLTVREIYQRRLEHLSQPGRELLELLSIPQRSMTLDLLVKFSDRDERTILDLVYELTRMELITRRDDTFEFANPRIRELIHSGIPPHRKVELHACFGLLLEARFSDPEEIVNELAYHLVLGNLQEKALHYSVLAAEISERVYAHEQAIEHYEKALSLTGESDITSQAEFLRKLVDLCMMIGSYGAALEFLQQVFSLSQEKPLFSPEELCNLNRKMAGIYQKMGEYHRALKYLYDGLALMQHQEKSFVTAQIHTNLGNIYMFLGDYQKAMAHCQISLEIVEPLGNLRELSEIYNTFGKIYIRQRSYREAVRYLTKSLQLREKIGDTLGIGRTYSNLGYVATEMGAADEAEDYYQNGLKIFEKIGFMYGSATIYNNLGILYHQRKTDWEKGISFLMKARELHERTGNEYGVAMTCNNLGLLFKDLGEFRSAEDYLSCSAMLYQKHSNDLMVNSIKITCASLFLDKGEPTAAYNLIHEGRAFFESSPENEEQMTLIWYELGRYYFAIGDLEEALRLCSRAMQLAKRYGDIDDEGQIKWLESEIHRQRGDGSAQERCLLESVRVLESEGSVFLLARTFWSLGSFYHDQNQDQKALEYIEKARDFFQKIGVRSYFEKAQDLLARMRERVLPNLFKFQGDQSDIATLYRVSHDIISTLDLPDLLEKILDAAIKTVKAERGLLILYDPARRKFDVKVARNMDRRTQDDMASVSVGVVERTVFQAIPVISTDATLDPRFKENQSVILFNIKSILCVPLKIKDRVIGAIYLDNRALTNQFTEKDLDFLVVLANQAAISIDNAILFERFRSATGNLNIGMIVMERNGHIVSCNSGAAQILRLETENLVGRKYVRGTRSVLYPEIGDLMLRSFERGEVIEREIRLQLPANETIIVDLSTSFIYDGFGECIGVLGIFRNVTLYKSLQEELELQKRMSAIGDLAAKISHRMKSYLAGVKILAQDLKRHVTEEEHKVEYLQEILLEVAEAERYVLNELAPQKDTSGGISPVNLNHLLQQIGLAMEKEFQAKGVAFSLDLSPQVPPIAGNETQLREVFNNLVKNALQAVSQDGTIQVRSGVEDGSLQISIQDNGCGIPEAIKEKIFEPFFTTREEGSGVGLWVVHSIIKNMGGKVVVKSQENEGTLIQVHLPVLTAVG